NLTWRFCPAHLLPAEPFASRSPRTGDYAFLTVPHWLDISAHCASPCGVCCAAALASGLGALSHSGAQPQIETRQTWNRLATSAGDHRPDRAQVTALRPALHDGRSAHRLAYRAADHRLQLLPRSQGLALVRHVDRLRRHDLHPAALRATRT